MRILVLTATAVPLVLAYFFGREVPLKDQLSLYGLLITVASIILGLSGAWLAIVFPGMLGRLYGSSKAERSADLQQSRRLFRPMLAAVVVIAVSVAVHMVVTVASSMLSDVDVSNWEAVARGLSFGILAFLGELLIIAMFYAVAPAVSYELNLRNEVARDDTVSQYRRR
ncbi:hypothetical protein [Sinimarinibacterium flocculans]|uniref:hypothetical protein n=1 Tax=Sinimarinibacterium flocculans TaxID=985250 RepID=UPI003513CC37